MVKCMQFLKEQIIMILYFIKLNYNASGAGWNIYYIFCYLGTGDNNAASNYEVDIRWNNL